MAATVTIKVVVSDAYSVKQALDAADKITAAATEAIGPSLKVKSVAVAR